MLTRPDDEGPGGRDRGVEDRKRKVFVGLTRAITDEDARSFIERVDEVEIPFTRFIVWPRLRSADCVVVADQPFDRRDGWSKVERRFGRFVRSDDDAQRLMCVAIHSNAPDEPLFGLIFGVQRFDAALVWFAEPT